jgi:type I restriction-modification system DNA methylase subunit/restriction endonuclease S subunit
MSKHKLYICQICNTTPDQISHHKTHLESQKHKDKREILKLKLSKISESKLIEEYNTSNIDEIISNKETFYYYEKLNNNSDEVEELQKMSELVKNISNREALRDKIHEIHNFLRNSGAGYGMNALKVFNFLYGLKKIEVYGLIDKYELKRPECEFSHLLQKAREEKNDEITELILSGISECVKKSDLSKFLYYELPQNIKANVFSHLVKEIESISEIEKTCNVLLSGKIYEYFIGRDETAISELGAYFTDRHIVNYILRKLNPVLLENGHINDMIDMFGGSGGFTTGYIDYLNEKYPDQIKWESEISKIHHYDINEDVIKSASLEILCMTRELPNIENITYRNAFTDDFGGRKFTYILTNPPYGGDKNKQSDIQIKREKIKNFIKSQIASNTLDVETLKNRNIQLKKIDVQERQEKKESEKTKVCLSSCSDRIQIFAKNHELSGTDKESCSLILMMELLAKNGTAIGVLKEGVFFNKTYKDLRKCLIENFNVVEIISVPQDQFENTSTKTSIIIFQNTDQKTTEVRFSDLVVEKNEVDEFAELNGEICMTKNKGDISNVSDKLVSIASVEDILMNPICSLNAKDYNKKVVVCGDGYELMRLEDLCEINLGTRITKKENKDGIIPVYGGGDITFYTNKSNRNKGTLIISRYALSKTCVRLIQTNFYLNDSGLSIKSKKENLQKFIELFLLTEFMQNYIYTNCTSGSIQKNLNMNIFRNLQIPIPKSQAKIQEWVDKISRPYDKMNSNKSRINELETFVQMRIKEISENEDCELVELGSICEINSKKILRYETSYGKNEGLYKFHTGATDGKFYCDKYNIDKYVIILNKTNGSGKCNIFLDKYVSCAKQTFICQSKNNELETQYIYYFLFDKKEKLEIGYIGACHKNLSNDFLNKFKIHIPKNKQLIQDLEPTFQEIETLQTEMKEAEIEYKRLIKELSQEAIPNQESHQDIPYTAPEPVQQIEPEVVDEPIQDEIVIKKKSSTKTARKLKSK